MVSSPAPWDSVVGYHMNPHTCGVAKFNAQLADRLGLPSLSIAGSVAAKTPLVSLKASELSEADLAALEKVSGAWTSFDVLYHDGARCRFRGTPHREAFAEVVGCPSTLNDARACRLSPSTTRLFSFGMAYRPQLAHYQTLASLVATQSHPVHLILSKAFHEGTTYGVGLEQEIETMRTMFEGLGSVFFLGSLSDEGIHDELGKADFFVGFFAGGVKANNTSVHAAMAAEIPVITNLGVARAPRGFVHRHTVFDIDQMRQEPWPDRATIERVGRQGAELYSREFHWDVFMPRLVEILHGS